MHDNTRNTACLGFLAGCTWPPKCHNSWAFTVNRQDVPPLKHREVRHQVMIGWDRRLPSRKRSVPESTQARTSLYCVCFSASKDRMTAGAIQSDVTCWRRPSGRQRVHLCWHGERVQGVEQAASTHGAATWSGACSFGAKERVGVGSRMQKSRARAFPP
jgi:hypothetical protein